MTHKNLPRATVTERAKASRIIKELRSQHPRGLVAELLGIQEAYISCIEHASKRYYDAETLKYYAPSWAIHKVLSFVR